MAFVKVFVLMPHAPVPGCYYSMINYRAYDLGSMVFGKSIMDMIPAISTHLPLSWIPPAGYIPGKMY